MTEYLRGHHYGLDSEVKTVVRLWFHHQEAQFYCDGLMNIPQGGRLGVLLYRNNCTQSNHKVQVTCFGFTCTRIPTFIKIIRHHFSAHPFKSKQKLQVNQATSNLKHFSCLASKHYNSCKNCTSQIFVSTMTY